MVITSAVVDPGTFLVSWSPTPLGAEALLVIRVSRQCSTGATPERAFWVLASTAVGAASPLELITQYAARFRVPYPGQRIALQVRHFVNGSHDGLAQLVVVVGP